MFGEFLRLADRELEDPCKVALGINRLLHGYAFLIKKTGIKLSEPKIIWQIHQPQCDEDGNCYGYADIIAWKAISE